MTMHHIVSDGWSMGVLSRSWARCTRVPAGRGRSAAAAGDPVRRLRGLAAAVAVGERLRRRSSTGGTLAGRAGAAGAADRPAAAARRRRSPGASVELELDES